VIEAKASVPAETPATLPAVAPAADGDMGKFDARAWAEQA
jgi:hypothetical protein